jgi:toxin ParE1/3/4
LKKDELIILEFAEKDIIETNNFYNSQSIELGNKFKYSLDYRFRNLLLNPDIYPFEFKTVRKFVMEFFPYNIFYICEKNIVYILAVFHQKRNPDVWKKRIVN